MREAAIPAPGSTAAPDPAAALTALLTSPSQWQRWRRRSDFRVDCLCRAELAGADLSERHLEQLDLRGANLSRGIFIGTRFSGSQLSGANLKQALLIGADLQQARLQLVDLRGADLRGAQLRGTDLESTLFITQSQIEGAVGDRTTRLPRSLRRPTHWG